MLALAGCGARTGLPVEVAPFDASTLRDLGVPLDSAVRDDDASAVAAALDGLRWELPCTDPRYDNHICATALDTSATTTVRGAPGALYEVTVRLRGVVELKTYLGGATDGHSNVGGTPVDDTWNVYDLAISDPPLVVYVNAGETGLYTCAAIDDSLTFRVATGATVRLIAGSVNALEVENWDGAMPIRVPGVAPYPAPYDGQFLEMDVTTITRVR